MTGSIQNFPKLNLEQMKQELANYLLSTCFYRNRVREIILPEGMESDKDYDDFAEMHSCFDIIRRSLDYKACKGPEEEERLLANFLPPEIQALYENEGINLAKEAMKSQAIKIAREKWDNYDEDKKIGVAHQLFVFFKNYYGFPDRLPWIIEPYSEFRIEIEKNPGLFKTAASASDSSITLYKQSFEHSFMQLFYNMQHEFIHFTQKRFIHHTIATEVKTVSVEYFSEVFGGIKEQHPDIFLKNTYCNERKLKCSEIDELKDRLLKAVDIDSVEKIIKFLSGLSIKYYFHFYDDADKERTPKYYGQLCEVEAYYTPHVTARLLAEGLYKSKTTEISPECR